MLASATSMRLPFTLVVAALQDLSSVYSSFKMREISEKNPIPNDKEGGEKHSAELDQEFTHSTHHDP